MILLDQKLISEDIIKKQFTCNIEKCKGACCVKGDAGAPLLQKEIDTIDKNLSKILEFVEPKHREQIQKNGFHKSTQNKHETLCMPSGECVFVTYTNGIAECGIEKANNHLDFNFQKPISCHLYPIRVSQVGEYTALNYHHWDICNPACELGKKKGVFVFSFLKNGLIRAFGKSFYKLLEAYANSLQPPK